MSDAAPIRRLDLTAGPEDIEVEPVGGPTGLAASPLEQLRGALNKQVEREPITLVVPARRGVTIRFDANIDAEALEAWRKKCRKRDRRTGTDVVDPIKLACTVLGNQASEIQMNGQPVTNDGEPVLFYSPTLHDMVGAHSTLEAVKLLFGVDGHLLDAADRVIAAAGYGDEVEEAPDPTETRG